MQIQYSEKYEDDTNEYRHVILPPSIATQLPKGKLLSETEWRALGVQQSRGWEHYAIHKPEPHILLFRRPLARGVNPLAPKKGFQGNPGAIQRERRREGEGGGGSEQLGPREGGDNNDQFLGDSGQASAFQQ